MKTVFSTLCRLRRQATHVTAVAVALCSLSARAQTLYWDPDLTAAGNDALTGAGLGGSGSWNTSVANWWDTAAMTAWANSGAEQALFSGLYTPGVLTAQNVSLTGSINANQLQFWRSGYTLSGGTLNLTGTNPALFAATGEYADIQSQIGGTAGLSMTGGGVIRLADGNTYAGTTTIADGALIISSATGLGTDTSAVVVTGFNTAVGSTNLKSYNGGTLVLDGTSGGFTFGRDLSLQGQGGIAPYGAALVSTGVNTLSGTVTMGNPYGTTFLNTRMIAADGTLNISNGLVVQGAATTTISSLGGTNQAGASFYNVLGTLSGTGTLEASGGGTLFLNPSDSSGFSGTVRVSASAASGQSVVRIDSPNVLGTRTATGTSSVIDMNGGVLAVLMDNPSVTVAGGSAANVYGRTSSTFFADHTPNSSVKDQTVTFGQLAFEDNLTITFNSRNGYGMTFGAAPVVGSVAGDNNSTFTNNLQGGAQLTFVGNFWSNTNNGAARTMTIGGNGNTTINGNIIASSAAYDHILTKTGTGTLTLLGTASTLDGAVNVNGGTVAINDWRAITNNTSAVNIGTGGTSATLAVVGNNVNQTNLTTSKVINLAGTTGGATILANQTGTSPGIIINSDLTATGGGSKTLTLAGTNLASNTINGVIPDNSATNKTSLLKYGPGTWVLAGSNTYTGTTTIADGTLRVLANGPTSTVIADASSLVFNASNVYAGGTLEFLGQASANNVETLGSLVPTNGSGTVKLVPGSGGTASLVFSSLGTVGSGGTANLVAPTANDTFSFTTAPVTGNIANAGLYYNGSDFAFIPGAGLAVRAPNYATDPDFATSATALTAGSSNEITGSFTTPGAVAIDSLKIDGSQTLTLGGNLTIRTAAGSTASGGILQTGGIGTITGNFGVGTLGSGTTVIRVDQATDELTIESNMSGAGGITKSGAGMLRLAGTNTQTGTISINEGTIRLASGGSLGGLAALTIRQDAALELNGVTPSNSIAAYNNNGTIRNTSATTDVTLTVGGSNGTGTSYGIVEDGGLAKINLVKIGTGNQSWLGLSTYTGTTTIGSTGIVSINNLQNGGDASGIGASSNAASNLIFNGTSTSQAFGGLSYTGTTNDETDRLFTFDGGANGGARIQSNGVNGATSSWTNTGTLAFGPNATNNPQSLVLGGGSSGDNRFFPNITDNSAGTGAATSVYKADSGVWYLMGTNTYSGVTELRGGALYVEDGVSLPTASNLVFNGGVVATTGLLSRTIGTGASQMSFASSATTANFRGGFAAGGSKLTVDWGSGNVWGSTANFISDGDGLIFGAANGQTSVTKADVELVSDFSLGTATGVDSTGLSYSLANSSSTVTVGSTAGLVVGQAFSGTNVPAGAYIVSINSATQFSLSANTGSTAAGSFTNGATVGGSLRTIRVDDNGNIGADFATLSGDISGTAGTGIRKMGSGILVMNGDNSYSGETNVFQGTLVVDSLGNSSGSGTSSLGTEVNANLDSNALTLGNGSTGAGILEYVGEGETSDRKIRLNTTTGNTQIHADGVGPLILTNVANDMVSGAKALYLRGVSASTNMITSQLSDNGGALSLVIDGSTSWVLTNSGNNYTGNTTVSAGALGIGSDTAIGGNLVLSNGSIFAYGADRTIANSVQLANNTSTSFIGDYSLDFTSPLQLLASANNVSLNNSIADGETLTFSAGVTANSLTANRGWTIDGTGTTIIDGDFTSSTAFGVALTKTGDGVFQLNGTGSNFNQGNATIDIDRGTLRIGGNGVIPDGTGYGNVVMSPDLVNGDTAILDLNGFTETINGLTMNTDGTAIIDNTSATAASLLFGGNDQAVSIGGGTGVYTIQNSGGGALSLTKIGSNTALIPTGVTLDYTGTTNVTGGTFTIASPVNGTTGLSATNSSTLALTGGITDPSLVTSIEVGGGSTLSLLDGVGSSLSNLTSLSLGNTGTGTATLNLNIGDGATDYLSLLTRGTLNLGNSVTFNMTDAGLAANTTYTLLNIVDGGINAYGITNMMQGATPGGFDMFTWFVDDNYVKLTTGNLITSDLYWRGSTDNTWNANVNNWSTDKSGSPAAVSIPGAGSKVFFAWDGIGTGPLTTTLEQNFKVNALVFESGTTTPSSVTIDPGAVSTNRIEVAPTNATDGISISAGGPSTVTMSAPVKIGADQTWNVSDAGSVLSIGALLGEADITKTGAGKVILPYASDPTFNSGVTSNLDITGGTVEIQNVGSLGNPVNSNLVNVTVGTGGAFYYNGASGTVANPIELAGGTLSSGTGTTTFSGPIDISANSIVNMADSNGAPTATARSITMSGVVSGSGTITVDSNNTASGGNQVGGTLTMSNAGNTWTGDLAFNRGTVTLTNAASPSFTTNDVTFNSFGRLILQGLNGATLDHSGDLTYAAGAIGEFQVDNTSSALSADFTVNQDGVMTLGSGGTGGTVRFYLADAYSKLNINGGVVLGGTSSISVGGDATGVVVIPSVISDGGSGYGLNVNDDAGGWNTTDRTLRLLGLNTFTGNVSLDSGVLEYDTVTNIAGGASALGSGSAINFTNSATLRFIGTTAQSTDRPITSTAGVITLSANGDEVTDTITYAGPITVGPTADGSQIILTGVPGREGIISGGISETGTTADMTVNGGTWTHATGTSNIGDDMVVTGADTIFNLASGVFQVRDDFTVQLGANLNLNATGALSFNTASLSADASLRAVSGATITINATDAINPTQFDGLRIGVDADGLGTLVLNADQTVTEFILGNRTFAREGLVDGTGTLTVAGNLDLYEGTINANLASTGSTALEKIGSETVTLAGDNSGLASTGSSIVYAGTLALDYTADNNTKLRAASALDLRGGTLQMIGNNGAATTQTVGSLTLASGGASTIIVDGGTGQEAVLNLGAITRGNLASDGTIRFVLPDGTQSATNGITTTSPNSIYGLLGTGATSTADAAYATVEDGTGLWFATNVGGNIVPLASTVNNDVTSWMMGDHITDSGSGFTGTAACININSLRYDAAGGSDLVVNDGTDIRIGSGGILVTSNVGGTPTMMGGNLVTGSGEVVVTQESAQTFQIGSMIGGTQAVVKSGTGTLLLSGLNTYTGATDIQSGTLQVGGGNAIGDSSPVNLATYEDSTLELLADEVIGRLSGGQRQTDDDHGVVAVNDHALTIVNSGANTTYSGVFTGTGSIIKQGTHNLNLNGISSGYTGVVTVDSGLLQLSGSGQINASVIRVNKGGALLLDNNGTTRSGTRILDTTTVTLDSADGTYNGQTIVRGLAIRTDQNANTSETIGTLNFASGANYLSGEGDVGTGTASSYIIADEFVRLNNATLAARGRSLGASSGERNQFKIGTAANETAFISTLVGGGGAAGTNTISIIPWAIAAANSGTNGALTDADMGNSLATYVAGTGIRPLDFATEYNTYSAAAATENVRESLTANLTGLSGKTVNALVINDNTTAASTTNVTGTGSGQMLTNTSGAFLFTLNTAATASSAHSVVLGGFDDGIAVGGGEYVFQVVNPSAAANTATLAATISSPLVTAADITKSGRGRLVLSGVNTAGGGANHTTLNEGQLEISDLDNIGGNTGGLVFAGGTLRIGAGFVDDISTRTISVLTGGGTIDTAGVNITVANGLGSGSGPLTKTGAGTLTMTGTSTSALTNVVTVTQGTLELAQTAGTAIGSGGLYLLSTANPTTVLFSEGNQIADNAPVTVESTGSNGAVFNLNGFTDTIGSLTVTGTTTNGSTVQTGSGGVLTVTGDITMNNNRNSTGNTGREVLITGTGTLGSAAPDSGTLDLGGAERTITVNRTGTNTNMDATIETIIQNGGIIKAGTQTLILTGTNTYADGTTIDDGTIRISSTANLGADVAGNDLTFSGGTLQSTGASVIIGASRNVSLMNDGGTIDVAGATTNAVVINGVVDGTDCAPLNKVGIGALALTNANTYEGGTNVNAGSLVVANTTGSATGTGQVTVAAGAVLTGDGAIEATGGNNVTINGSVLVGDPTSMTGTDLAISATGGGSVIFGTGSTTSFDIWGGLGSAMLNAAADADRLILGSQVTLGGTLDVTNSSGSTAWAKFDSWQLFDWSGITGGVTPGTAGNEFSSINLPDLSSYGYVWDLSDLYIGGTITVVPEPARVMLVLAGLGAVLLRRRRR